MGAHDVLTLFATLLAFATIGILILTKKVMNGWIWAAVPLIAFLWYWVLAYGLMAYYMWGIR